MWRHVVACIVLAGCGRLRFDEREVGGDDDGGVESTDAGFTGMEKVYGKASNPGAGDLFGQVVMSADGSTLAVTAFHEDSSATGIDGNQADNSAPNAGAVYVFVRAGNVWTQQVYVKASNTGAGDQFGRSVAISSDGSTLAVGANLEDSSTTGIDGNQADNSASDAGAVYVFTRAGTRWTQQAFLKASNTGAGDDFGTHLAMSADGSTLAVGAFSENSAATGIGGNQADNSAADAGAVYVFSRASTTWTQQAYVKASNTDAGDLFGESLALSSDGNTLAVGAPLEDSSAIGIDGSQADDSLDETGAVYVFTRAGVTWTQRSYVKASNTDRFDQFGAFDQFGWGVALSANGDVLAVGTRGEASAAVGINGLQADNSAYGAGAVYLFTLAGAAWTQQAYIKASNTGAGDFFGETVRLSSDGNTLGVTAPQEDSTATGIDGSQADNLAVDSGAVYLFTRVGTAWAQRAYVKSTNCGARDNVGGGLALSADGSMLVIGAGGEDSAATGIGGDQSDDSMTDSGAIYIYY